MFRQDRHAYQNALTVTAVRLAPGFDEARALAAQASSEGGQDLVDGAIRSAVRDKAVPGAWSVIKFVPFDPAAKVSEALVKAPGGETFQGPVTEASIRAIAAPRTPSMSAT